MRWHRTTVLHEMQTTLTVERAIKFDHALHVVRTFVEATAFALDVAAHRVNASQQHVQLLGTFTTRRAFCDAIEVCVCDNDSSTMHEAHGAFLQHDSQRLLRHHKFFHP
jgi:hypothetical protein